MQRLASPLSALDTMRALSLGKIGAAGIASYLPTIYGSFPIWHASQTTPNADGAISAMADVSLGLYPISQGVGANQPTRGSGKVTFSGSHWLASTDATLTGWATGQQGLGVLVCAELNGSTPASSEMLFAFGSTASANIYSQGYHTVADKLKFTKRASATAEVNGTSASNMDATRASYVFTAASGASTTLTAYLNGSQVLTGSGAIDTGSPDRFALGAYLRGTATFFLNGSVIAACVMSRVPNATERSQWDAWVTAGCPL